MTSVRSSAARRPALDAAVLDAAYRQSLVVVRSLGRAGLRVGAFDCDRRAPAIASRHAAVTGLLPDPFAGAAVYRTALDDLLDRHAPAVLIPAHDGTVEFLREHRAALEERTRVALAPEPAMRIAVDKELTLERAAGLGLSLPRSLPVRAEADLLPALAEIGLPAVLKPARSWVDTDAGRARLVSALVVTAGEARAAAAPALAAGAELVLQEHVPGAREAIWLVLADDGRVAARFAQVAHRMFPVLGGASVLRESIPLPRDATDDAERLLAAIGYAGFAEVEFRRDRAGRPVLMEINPRLSASLEVAVRAGVDIPLLVHRWATGEELPAPGGYRAGVRMRWLAGDLLWLNATLRTRGRPDHPGRARALTAFLADTLRPTGYDYVARDDLRPALVAARGFARIVARHGRG